MFLNVVLLSDVHIKLFYHIFRKITIKFIVEFYLYPCEFDIDLQIHNIYGFSAPFPPEMIAPA